MPEGHALLTLQQLQHSGLEWKPVSGLKSLILTLLMIPMIHSLASLCQHTISHFHLKPSYRECHCPSKPRFTKGLFVSCDSTNFLYKQFHMNATVLNKSRYNKYQNKYNFVLKVARKKYFYDKLISVSSDLRKTWSVIKQIIA